MPFKKSETITKKGGYRRLDSVMEMQSAGNWFFKYVTLKDGSTSEWTPGDLPNKNKNDYPPPIGEVTGTIFLESSPGIIYMTSIIGDIIVDTKGPEFVSEDIQYVIINSDRKCSFTINSDTLIDVCQLRISCGDEVLYECARNKTEHIISESISKLSYNKTGNTYVLSFTLDKSYSVEALNENQLEIEVWDIAANKAKYRTKKFWRDLDNDPSTLKPLIIEFIDVEPEDKLISKNIEGKVLVKITNPNDSMWKILPTFDLFNNSIGIIDESSITCYNGDPEKSKLVSPTDPEADKVITLFYITHINKKGNINIETWIDIDNNEIKEFVKNETYADATLGPFVFDDGGRKYKFDSYVPEYLTDETYKAFIKFTEDFLNTSQESLSTGNAISTLEKIARINNFNDPFRTETPLLSEYVKQFNIEVNPNLNEYVYFLDAARTIKDKETDGN